MKQHPTDADVLNYKETNSDMLKKKPSSEEDQQIKLFEHVFRSFFVAYLSNRKMRVRE